MGRAFWASTLRPSPNSALSASFARKSPVGARSRAKFFGFVASLSRASAKGEPKPENLRGRGRSNQTSAHFASAFSASLRENSQV